MKGRGGDGNDDSTAAKRLQVNEGQKKENQRGDNERKQSFHVTLSGSMQRGERRSGRKGPRCASFLSSLPPSCADSISHSSHFHFLSALPFDMFDGSFKAKRTINLGGNKQQVDKQKLLRQAQEERRLREAERLRLKSAERIQVMAMSSACHQYPPVSVSRRIGRLADSNLYTVLSFVGLVSWKNSSKNSTTGSAPSVGSGYPCYRKVRSVG